MNSLNQGKTSARLMSGCKRHNKIKCINLTSENICILKAPTMPCAWTNMYTIIVFSILE